MSNPSIVSAHEAAKFLETLFIECFEHCPPDLHRIFLDHIRIVIQQIESAKTEQNEALLKDLNDHAGALVSIVKKIEYFQSVGTLKGVLINISKDILKLTQEVKNVTI